ncbi:hypothetical protein IX51_10910 [uncultured archaeon]|nr:hypothetical protein IX51_10910 [uncultured archaeon]
MVKVTDSINVIVRENLIYSLMINSGLANYTSLARKIQNQVEFVTGKKVKINTIVKTLTSYRSKEVDSNAIEILKKSNLSVEYKYTEGYFDSMKEVGDNAMLVVREAGRYKCIMKSDDTNDLAMIRIILPSESAGEPGITLLLTEYLNIFGIDVKNIYRLDTEIWLIVNVDQAGQITDRISKLLYSSEM